MGNAIAVITTAMQIRVTVRTGPLHWGSSKISAYMPPQNAAAKTRSGLALRPATTAVISSKK